MAPKREHRWAVILAAAGLLGVLPLQAQETQRVTIPTDTVVRLKLEDRLTSRDAQVGDHFAAAPAEKDASGFPLGTRFEGTVREVQRHTEEEPGILDVEFRRAYLPDGERVNLRGQLASMARDDVKQLPDGRLEARKKGGGKMDWKWAGYGAAGGAILSTIFGGKLLKGVLLGGLGGAIYGYINRDKDKAEFRDVDLPAGTEFGMRLAEQVAFSGRSSYQYAERPQGSEEERVAGERQEARYGDAVVRLDGKRVELEEHPLNLNGTLYVPLSPIAGAAGMTFSRQPGSDAFTLETPAGAADAVAGETNVNLRGRERIALAQAPLQVNGAIFVSPEYLGRVAGFRTNWSPAELRLDLETQK